LDNILTVGGSARGKKRTGLHQPQTGGLLEGAVRRQTSPRHSGGSKSAAQDILTLLGPTLKKL
jgi:hypothetical protein